MREDGLLGNNVYIEYNYCTKAEFIGKISNFVLLTRGKYN